MKQKTTRHFTKFGVELKWDGERTSIDERPVEKYTMHNLKEFDANRRLFAYTEKYIYIFDVTPGFKSVTFLLEDGWEGVVTLQKTPEAVIHSGIVKLLSVLERENGIQVIGEDAE